ncbi:Spherulin-4 [Orchesella cincta]|uniref:Spherulin-4 n=1 Tax=Orchesella cincta TaxID=48709 RepID=A0A1D2MQK4_ORCCI|nr:Spherulin-4 [Orchesella cincta]
MFLWLFFATLASALNYSNAIESGTIIPLYIYPKTNNGGNAWQALFDAYRAHPINTWAIVNVNSGPGTRRKDANYINAIRDLHAAGIKTLGYVLTNYTQRSEAAVKADVDRWKQLYQPTGIFFDEMAYDDVNSKVQYYQNLNNYAKSQGYTFTVGNPGTRTVPRYFNTVDNIVVFESDTGFPSTDLICSQDTNGKGRSSVSILPYNIGSLNTGAVTEAKTCAGFIYVTNDSGINPWDTLPGYLTQLFGVLKG